MTYIVYHIVKKKTKWFKCITDRCQKYLSNIVNNEQVYELQK